MQRVWQRDATSWQFPQFWSPRKNVSQYRGTIRSLYATTRTIAIAPEDLTNVAVSLKGVVPARGAGPAFSRGWRVFLALQKHLRFYIQKQLIEHVVGEEAEEMRKIRERNTEILEKGVPQYGRWSWAVLNMYYPQRCCKRTRTTRRG